MGAKAGLSSTHLATLPIFVLFWAVFSYLDIINLCLCDENANILCLDSQREGLLSFKTSLTDPSGRLSSWVGEDCCKWNGVKCNNRTGHVTELNLRNPYQLINGGVGDPTAYKRSCLGLKTNPSLLQLEYLKYLDLSLYDFEGIEIPEFFGQLKNLRYLNLSFASFSGNIPPHLGNLSSLQYLDLYADSYSGTGSQELRAENHEKRCSHY